LNQVTAKELVTIRGIGKVLSERIIKYRKRIQGFSKLNQLDEVYGLKPVVLERMKRQLTISSPPQIQKIALDRASLAELVKLPYLNQNEAKKIISLRTSQGSIRLLYLERIEGFDALKIKRLTLYLF
jgi:DNA uptake protein ComE-like DNA-binding protein